MSTAHEIVERDLSDDELRERLAAFVTGGPPDHPAAVDHVREALAAGRHDAVVTELAEARKRYRYVRPFAAAADALIEYLQNTDGRFMLGLRPIDVMTRGFGRGELAFFTGFSHSGKTQLFLTGVVNNRHRPVVLFTLDEPAELVLAKLVSLRQGWNFEWVEERIKAQDTEVITRVRDIAAVDFNKLVVVDEATTLAQMADAMNEAEDYLQEPVAAIGIDYLSLLADGDDVEKKSQGLKRWTVAIDKPVLCIHQAGKGEAGKGQPITMTSMLHGGHAEAIFLLGCRRKRDDVELDDYERARHANTISISVVKNKRPPSKKGEYDFYLHPESGIIRELNTEDMGRPLGSGVSTILAQRNNGRSNGQRMFDEEVF